MRVVLISNSASFPWGMAASNRVKLLAKGLIEHGFDVSYIGTRGANTSQSTNTKLKGVVDGIRYYYPGLSSRRSKSWLLRRIDDFMGKWLSLLFFAKLKVGKQCDAVILYTRNYKEVKFWGFWANNFKTKCFLEICEWPIIYPQKRSNKNAFLYCTRAPFLVDGAIPISDYITQQIHQLAKEKNKQIPVCKVPILVDQTLFTSTPSPFKGNKAYLLYSGSLAYSDIILLILKTFVLLKKEGFSKKLIITGNISKEKHGAIINFIEKNGLTHLIAFSGYLNDNEYSNKLKHASALLAPLPDDMQTMARFPTKLAGYLASGNPVITNEYGEAKKLLKHKENAILLNSFTPEALKSAIEFRFKQPDQCQSIGNNGRKLAYNLFEYTKATKDLSIFLKNFIT